MSFKCLIDGWRTLPRQTLARADKQMAEPGRTVRLSGLPTDMDDDRLRDKLSIHFLRSRNGGGEIDSVIILGAKANSALLTFEDSRVAQSVIQRGWHVLEVDGVKYELSASEPRETLEPDKVILRLTATVDYSQLPAGKTAVLSLAQNHPDVQTTFDFATDLCKLYGAYSKVQSALAFLLGDPALGHRDSGGHGAGGPSSAQKPLSQDQSWRHSERHERRPKAGDGEGSSQREEPLRGGYNGELASQAEFDTSQKTEHSSPSDDEVPLIVDADLFQYLKRCCVDEYKHILSVFNVDVVEMTHEGLTSLFLQAATAAGSRDAGRKQERLILARAAISRLCQDNEGKVCQAQLSKVILSTERGLEREMEELSLRFPKLLLNDDDKNVYFTGSHSDVSEAKKLLLLDCVGLRSTRDRLTTSSSLDSASSAPYDEERSPPIPSFPTVQPEGDQLGQILHLDEDDRRGEGAKKYKLAARFKDSSLLANRPGLSPPSKLSRPSPVLVPDAQSETAWSVDGRVSRGRGSREETFEKGDVLHSSPSIKCRLTCNCDLTESPSKSRKAVVGTIKPSSSESILLQAGQREFPLRRSNSYTGTPLRKSQDVGPKVQDESGKSAPRTRGRSSSFSNQKGMAKPKVYNAEITVAYLMWLHIKDAYFGRMEDLSLDVQVKESASNSSRDLITVIIRGADQSKVTSCQLGLQKLVDNVSADYSQEKITLSELGVTDTSDETLQACFAEVRSRFKKITIHQRRKSVYFLGPKKLCTQVSNSVRGVFSISCRQMFEDLDTPSTFNWNQPADSQLNEDQSLHSSSNSLAVLEGQAGKDYASSSEVREESPHGTELINACLTKPKRDPAIRQKVKRELEGQGTLVEPQKITDDRRQVNGMGSTSTTHTDEGIATPRMESLTESSYDLDANQLVSQVQASLQNLFSNGPQMPETRESSSLWSSNCTPSTALEINESHSPFGDRNAWTMLEGQIGKDYGTDVKPKVRREGTLGPDGQKPLSNTSASGIEGGSTNDVGLASTDNDVGLHVSDRGQHSSPKETMQQRKAELQDSPKQSKSSQGDICVCGKSDIPLTLTECGATMCLRCLEDVHIHCRTCRTRAEPASQSITGTMSLSNLSISVPGHPKDAAIKITYYISDGIQGENHPSPGQPFSSDIFEAYFPDCDKARRLLPRLKEAFKRGLTFTILHTTTGDRVMWDCIPHKTSINGGKSGNGYPDSTYLKRLSEVLSSHGI